MKFLLMHSTATLLALTLTSEPVRAAEEKPLWEAGAGVSVLSLPAYRGSNQTNTFVLPVPFFSYHGDFFKADRHGIRGSFFDSELLDVNVSLALSPPAGSKDIEARADMADLKATFEIGPQINVTFWRSENKARYLKLLLPLRAAFTIESSPQDVGWVFSPSLNLDITDLPWMPKWNLGLLAGPVFGNQRQNAYYYSVAPQYATIDRPAYDAPSGYAGMQYTLGLSKRFPNTWVGAFLRYGNLDGASFADSPLVLQKDFLSAGVAISWVFGESSTRVMVDD